MKKIVIIGGGASGMAAAITAAQQHPKHQILILERKEQLGKKILSTGNGRCNFTNAVMHAACFFSDSKEHPQDVGNVIKRFGTAETLVFFRELGILPKSRNGYYYPRSNQASAILQVMENRIRQLGIAVHTSVQVQAVRKTRQGFKITADGKNYEADRVILSCGGRAAAVLGSDGSGYTLAKELGHTLVPVVPALVQLKTREKSFAKASGVRVDGTVTAYCDGEKCGEDTGEIQITAYGISGIPVFQISRHIAKAIHQKKKAVVLIDFLPEMSEQELRKFWEQRKAGKETLTMEEFLVGVFNQKLAVCLLNQAQIAPKLWVKKMKDADWDRLLRVCKRTSLEIQDTNGFDNAQVCAGGIRLDEVNLTSMESRVVKHLYLAGELLDVDGLCGGYNLQWAWATGCIAGEHAAGKDAVI